MRMIKVMYFLVSLFLVAVLLSNCTHIKAYKRAYERQVKSFEDLKKAKKDLEGMMKRKKDMEVKIGVKKEERDRLERDIKQLEGSKKIEDSKVNKLRADLDQVNDQIEKQEAGRDQLGLKIKEKEKELNKKQKQKDELDKGNDDEFI